MFDNPEVNGLFNLGTGRARTYLDLAHAVCDAAGKPRAVEFIDMPDEAKGAVSIVYPGPDGSPAGRRLFGTVHSA
jgi:nucleoside-diphosphate-sugar epimerase